MRNCATGTLCPRKTGEWHRRAVQFLTRQRSWRSREVRFPDCCGVGTHCRGQVQGDLPPMPPREEQSGTRSWWRCRHPAIAVLQGCPIVTPPPPTHRVANLLAPDWHNRFVARDTARKCFHVIVCHDPNPPTPFPTGATLQQRRISRNWVEHCFLGRRNSYKHDPQGKPPAVLSVDGWWRRGAERDNDGGQWHHFQQRNIKRQCQPERAGDHGVFPIWHHHGLWQHDRVAIGRQWDNGGWRLSRPELTRGLSIPQSTSFRPADAQYTSRTNVWSVIGGRT